MAVNGFAPAPPATIFQGTGANVTKAIGTGATVLVSNYGGTPAWFVLGAGPATNLDQTILPGESLPITTGGATEASVLAGSGTTVSVMPGA
jgi:hypothetical protein